MLLMRIYQIIKSQVQYTYAQAEKEGVTVKLSTNLKKKIDVFKNHKKIASVGARGMMDYPTWVVEKGEEYANNRRRLYKIRNEKTRHIYDTPAYWADVLLW